MEGPGAVVFGEALAHFAAQQAAPGSEIHLQKIVIQRGLEAAAMGSEQRRSRVVRSTQGRAVGGGEGQIPQSLTGGQGLLHPVLGEAGEVVAPLNAVLQIEAAQAMANQQDPERHRRKLEQKASYWLAFSTTAAVRCCADQHHGAGAG